VAGARRLARIQNSLDRFGARLILVCRFIPGGRTGVTVTCGLVGYRRKRFVAATAFAAVVWASYAFFLGRLGGKAFADRPWAGLLLALGAALVVSGIVEGIRWVLSRRRQRRRVRHAHGPGLATPLEPDKQPASARRRRLILYSPARYVELGTFVATA
jgi:membrane protein DedA with SNARE-associated domain